MTLPEFKDQAAKEYGYDDWSHCRKRHYTLYPSHIHDRAATLFAAQERKVGYDEGIHLSKVKNPPGI